MTHNTIPTHSQAPHLPEEAAAPNSTQTVADSIAGKTRTPAPAMAAWDSFFFGAALPSEDFMCARAEQTQPNTKAKIRLDLPKSALI